MAKNKFTFKTAEGKVETRSSDRTYTHVVVGRRDYGKERAYVVAQRKHEARVDLSNYEHYRLNAENPVGAVLPGRSYEIREDMHAQGLAIVAKYPTSTEYIEAKYAARLAAVPEGERGPEVVLRWSMSARAAFAAIAEFEKWHCFVRVVEL